MFPPGAAGGGGVGPDDGAGAAAVVGRGLHPYTFQLNLSRFTPDTLDTPEY